MKILSKSLAVFCLVSFCALILTAAPAGKAVTVRLPKPHYHAEQDDPAWLQTAVQVHGHLGPAIVVGIRLGEAGRNAVKAQGYFDLEVLAEGPFASPPQSCLLDGLQIATGATLGKRNLQVAESKDYLVRVRNKRTGHSAEVRPKPELLKLMWSRLEAHDHEKGDAHAEMHRVEAIARQIAAMSSDEIMTVKLLPSDQ